MGLYLKYVELSIIFAVIFTMYLIVNIIENSIFKGSYVF